MCLGGGACTYGACDAAIGCKIIPLADNVLCADGNACTQNDKCKDATCIGKPNDCTDYNVCTEDFCDPVKGCFSAPANGLCDDGDPCTFGDHCNQSICLSGIVSATACDDGNTCTSDNCDKLKGCQHISLDGACSDGDPCSDGDGCIKGACVSGKNACSCQIDADCPDDADLCNGKAACISGAAGKKACGIADKSVVDCNDKDGCTVDSCDPKTGFCDYDAAACDDKDGCTVDSCKSPAGCLHVTAPDGTQCDKDKACSAGKCGAGCLLQEQLVGTDKPDNFFDVAATNGGGWIAVGTTGSTFKPQGVGWLVEFAADGAIEWTQTLGGEGKSDRILVAVGANLVARTAVGTAGSNWDETTTGWVVRTDTKGVVLWEKQVSGPGKTRLEGLTLLNEGLIGVGSVDPGDVQGKIQGWVVRLTDTGEIMWQTQIGYQSNDFLRSVRLVAGGGILVGGLSYTDGNDGDGDALLARLTLNGAVVWDFHTGGPKYQTINKLLANEGGIIFGVGTTNSNGAYDGMLIAAQGTGKMEWIKTFGGAKDDRWSGGTVFSEGMLGVGYSDSSTKNGDADGWVVRVDGSGYKLWEKTLGGPYNDKFNAAATLSTGGAVIVGQTGSPLPGGQTGDPNGWVVRIDSAANSACK